MFVGAIIVLGETASTELDIAADPVRLLASEWLAGGPIASVDVIGQSALHHTIQRLQRTGIEPVAFATKDNASHLAVAPGRWPRHLIAVPHSADVWSSVQHTFDQYANSGVETVVFLRLGAYIEFDLNDVVQFHRAKGQPVTRIKDQQGPLDLWILDSARCRKAGTRFSRVAGVECAARTAHYDHPSYVNRLSSAGSLRQFVIDTFLARCSIRLPGRETRPGIWIDPSARVDRQARLVAPAYIGAEAKIGASALITRFSNVERGCEIDYGTVVEDSSVLADTYLGTWLELSHAVVCGTNLTHLHHKTTTEIEDPRLVGAIARGSRRRAISEIWSPRRCKS